MSYSSCQESHRRLGLTASALAAALALGACADSAALGPTPVLPTERFSIAVRSRPEELRLAVHAQGLSPNQGRALAAYGAAWGDAQGGPILIRAPGRVADPEAAWRMANEARDLLARRGVDPGSIGLAVYDPPPGAPPVLVLVYERNVAVGPQCGDWENLAHTGANREYANFGCAVTADMAAQIAYPTDLIAPQASTPPDAGRRQTVLDNYRKGAITSSAKDSQASGAVSTAVQ